MKRLLLSGLLLLTASASADVQIAASLEPDGRVYVGQRVRLNVGVRTDSWFTTAPKYPELKLDGAVALQPEAFGVNFTEREGATTWAGQRQRYVVFPQRVGELTIPPIEVTLAVAVDGKAGQLQTVTTNAIRLNVVMPPGGENVDAFVVTPRLDVRDEWDRDLDELKVGDAITRTITQTANDTFAMMLPPVAFEPVDGLAAYAATPALDDRVNRGVYSATRTDRVTYVLQRDGDFELPPIVLHRFDIQGRKMVAESLDAVSVTVAPNPDAVLGETVDDVPESSIDAEARIRQALDWLANNAGRLTILTAVLVALKWIWDRFGADLLIRLRRWRKQRSRSEQRYFGELLSAVRSNDPDEIVRRFWRWADRMPAIGSEMNDIDPKFARVWFDLAASRYGADREDDTRASRMTVAQLKRFRRRWLRESRAAGAAPSALPLAQLNPRTRVG